MAARARQERDREVMREKILDAARELFVTLGYEAVTMRAIGEKMGGYSATTLYLYFDGKDAILRALCDTDFLTLRGAFDQIARVEDPIERLKEIGKAYVQFALQYPNHYRFMFMTARPPEDPKGQAIEKGNPDQDVYAFVREAASAAIASGRIRPEYRDPELLTQMLWSSVHGMVALRMTKANDSWVDWRPATESTQAMIDVMTRGLIAEGE
jgi:AcrR family transcriptional regulator